MYLRRCKKVRGTSTHAYWALVQSVRTARGPRQQVVAYLGDVTQEERQAVAAAATAGDGAGQTNQSELFTTAPVIPAEIDVNRVRVGCSLAFGGPWLGMQLARKLGLVDLFNSLMANGHEDVPWSSMALVLSICRLCRPSSELFIAEHLYAATALAEILGVPEDKINDDRLYRALDRLLPHKEALETHLKNRLGELFNLSYDLLLYDVTSTYFEGQCKSNPLAQRGYSRDNRADCKQVCIALVVSRCGMPLGYQVFAGNRADVTTVQEIVETMEKRYGNADRIWVMDRGMVSQKNLTFLKQGQRRYILGTPRSLLKNYREALTEGTWNKVHEGLEVQICPGAESGDVYILCRSQQRRAKEKAMHDRFEKRIEEGLSKLQKMAEKRTLTTEQLATRVGCLMGRNTRAAGLFKPTVTADAQGRASLQWEHEAQWRDWATLSEGCYLLQSNVADWSAGELWQAYMQLTQAEAAFRIHKSDLQIRPVWHQLAKRVEAHILVCFIAYVFWKTLAQMCTAAGLGDEPRKVLEELAQIQLVEVILPTVSGVEIRRRCVSQPTPAQAVLLEKLGLQLPRHLSPMENTNVVKTVT